VTARKTQGGSAKERAGFSLLPSHRRGIEAVAADTARAFGRHTHDQFGIGLIERGAQKSASGRGTVEAGPGDIITVNPGEVHDGTPIGEGGRAWRMLYLDPAIVAELSADLAEGGWASCEFTTPTLRDARIAARFTALFDALTTPESDQAGLSVDEALLCCMSPLLEPRRAASLNVPAGIASARALIDDDPLGTWTLAMLAEQAGIGRYQFLRGFARATGLPPHAYTMQRRIHHARGLIRQGMRLADAAAASGFADQSHMTRLFVRTFGIAPGSFAKART